MIRNGRRLFLEQPIARMESTKQRGPRTSWGMSEAGYDIRIAQTITLGGNFPRFSLASTMEKFQMPTDLVGIVHDKSTWARYGLSVFNTVIEPGWNGYLTLELVYHGDAPLTLKEGDGIAQVIFHVLEERAEYAGKYQGQENMPIGPVLG